MSRPSTTRWPGSPPTRSYGRPSRRSTTRQRSVSTTCCCVTPHTAAPPSAAAPISISCLPPGSRKSWAFRLPEAAEIVGYHLEQVCVLRGELGPLDDETKAVGGRAAATLDRAGRRGLARGDAASALNLFTRAAALAPDEEARIEITLRRGIAAQEAGDFVLSESVLADVESEAAQARLEAVVARARIQLALLRFHRRPIENARHLTRVGEETLATFERLEDAEGRALALSLLAHERWLALHCAEAERLLELALEQSERVSDDRLIASTLVALARAVLFGPRPANEAAKRCEELLAHARRLGPTAEASISIRLAPLEAMRGHAERARRLAHDSIAVLEETASRCSWRAPRSTPASRSSC